MKRKLTITIDEDVVPRAKQYARSKGASLSQVIEDHLRGIDRAHIPQSFSARWRGRFRPSKRKGVRYERLAKKYL